MGEEILDLYSDYLLCSSREVTATGLSGLVDGDLSHDKVTRFLNGEELGAKELWLKVKGTVRRYENEDGCLIFDDTIIKKPYMDENEIVAWYFDHTENRNVKGIDLLSCFYWTTNGPVILRVPIQYEIVAKSEEYKDKKSGEMKKRSPKTKNEMMQEMILQVNKNRVKYRYILADSWFSSVDNMEFIQKHKKLFIFEMESNRLAAVSESAKRQGQFDNIEHMDIPEEKPVTVWLKGLRFPVALFKQVFKNKDGSTGRRFLVSNKLDLSSDQFLTIYKRRWSVEEYHESLKQNASIGKSPARTEKSQSNHIFSSIYAYVKFEVIKHKRHLSQFTMKAKIYAASLRAAFEEYHAISGTPMPAFA
jgi:hypothetical protein